MSRALLAVALVAATVGCSSTHAEVLERDVAASSYVPLAGVRLDRTAGRLRRLGLAPLVVEASPGNPRWCLDPCDPEPARREIDAEMRTLLTLWRGYELVPLDGAPPLDGQSVRELGRRANVDGVLVTRVRLTYLTWVDAAAWFATFTFAIPISVARSGYDAEAELYETASGRLVWRSRARSRGAPPLADTPAQIAERLLGPLELAWPAALARGTSAPPK